MRHKLRLSSSAVEVLMQFNVNTFTLEFNHSPGLEMCLKEKLLERHPGGPFGSRNSYYRTERGMQVWEDLTRIRNAT